MRPEIIEVRSAFAPSNISNATAENCRHLHDLAGKAEPASSHHRIFDVCHSFDQSCIFGHLDDTHVDRHGMTR